MIEFLRPAILILILFGCSSQPEYKPTQLPDDTTDLWLTDGTIGAETVLIVAQGGPSEKLVFEEHGRTSIRYLPGYADFETAYVHQAQTYNPALFVLGENFSMDMARLEKDTTTQMLAKTIDHYKEDGRRVVVIGHSYGAFILVDYLASFTPAADQYIVSAGRLDVDLPMVEDHKRGWTSQFEEDGRSYISIEDPGLEGRPQAEIDAYYVRNRLKAAYGEPRFTELLRGADLSKVHFFYAINDQNVGALTDDEKAFLRDHNATVHQTTTGHGETLYRFIDAVMYGSVTLAH